MDEKNPKIGILIPVYSTVPSTSFSNITNFILGNAKKYPIMLSIVDSTFITLARNRLIDNFLKSNADYALFIDSDMVLPHNAIEGLLSHKKDAISALYLRRLPPHEPVAMKKNNEKYENIKQIPSQDEFEVDATGLGCFLIKREVIEAIAHEKPIFAIEEKADFQVKGEDTIFCEKIKKAGYKIWVSKKILVGHFGATVFPQNTQ